MKNTIVAIAGLSFALCLVCRPGVQLMPQTMDCDYLAQTPPGIEPELFAQKILNHTFGSVFSSDGSEYFTSRYVPDSTPEECSIAIFTRVGEHWTGPEIASFSSTFIDNDPCISTDGKQIFFRSDRPLYGGTVRRNGLYLWTAKRTTDGWGEAVPVTFGGRDDIPAGYPSVIADGTLFFATSMVDGLAGPTDIAFARLVDDQYSAPVNLGTAVNSEYGEGDLFVAPDGSYLIVSCWGHPDNTGNSNDLYISFRNKDGTWPKTQRMNPIINTDAGENCPQVSPDGKYLFFNRYSSELAKTGQQGMYWIDVQILHNVRSSGRSAFFGETPPADRPGCFMHSNVGGRSNTCDGQNNNRKSRGISFEKWFQIYHHASCVANPWSAQKTLPSLLGY